TLTRTLQLEREGIKESWSSKVDGIVSALMTAQRKTDTLLARTSAARDARTALEADLKRLTSGDPVVPEREYEARMVALQKEKTEAQAASGRESGRVQRETLKLRAQAHSLTEALEAEREKQTLLSKRQSVSEQESQAEIDLLESQRDKLQSDIDAERERVRRLKVQLVREGEARGIQGIYKCDGVETEAKQPTPLGVMYEWLQAIFVDILSDSDALRCLDCDRVLSGHGVTLNVMHSRTGTPAAVSLSSLQSDAGKGLSRTPSMSRRRTSSLGRMDSGSGSGVYVDGTSGALICDNCRRGRERMREREKRRRLAVARGTVHAGSSSDYTDTDFTDHTDSDMSESESSGTK
ncbi:hypothetical protein KIPB_009843, partial [Kipferlia bialata]